jgi:nucleotide-binding universal stress UspA family protein
VRFAQLIGAEITALGVEVDFHEVDDVAASGLIGLAGVASEEEARSHAARAALLHRFSGVAAEAGVRGHVLQEKRTLYEVAGCVARAARTRDLCLIPTNQVNDDQRAVLETVIFSAGRPVIGFGAGSAGLPTQLNTVVLAWDGGRCAARAMADGLPFLSVARDVRILTVTNEKPAARAGRGAEALRHLKIHGVAARADDVDAAGRSVGEVIDAYLEDVGADLLIMGAYGHSRLREFILGGATRHAIHHPKAPVCFSH